MDQPLQNYDHGLEDLPSHYIPLCGALHGMFFDPITNLFVGDGPPRPTPERPDGSMPCFPETAEATASTTATTATSATTATLATTPAVTNAGQAGPIKTHPDDALHIQTRDFIERLNVAPQSEEGFDQLSHLAPNDNVYPAGRAPNKKLFFCRCTGEWLADKHECDRGPFEDMPEQSGLAIRSAAELPEGWVTHRIVADPRMYPGGVAPAETAAGPTVGGLPAKYFTPVAETGTDPRTVAGWIDASGPAPRRQTTHPVPATQPEPASSEADAQIPGSSLGISAISTRSEYIQPQNATTSDDNPDNPVPDLSDLSVEPTITTESENSRSGPVPELSTLAAEPAIKPPESDSSCSGPSAGNPTRGRGAPATMVGGKRRRGKGGKKGRRGGSNA